MAKLQDAEVTISMKVELLDSAPTENPRVWTEYPDHARQLGSVETVCVSFGVGYIDALWEQAEAAGEISRARYARVL